ncbi:MAG TPA: hypothetical protein VF458_16690 [Ktedonobacteraceae bacterium]
MVEVAFERIHVSGPELAQWSQPGIHLLKWFRFQPVETAPGASTVASTKPASRRCFDTVGCGYEADERSLQPTVVTRPEGSISRGGAAPQ